MTQAEHIEESAAGVVSLPPEDPERVAAYAHARACATCARALRQAEGLLAALDALPVAPAPPAPRLRAVARPILARLSASIVPTRLLSPILVSLWIVLVLLAKHRAGGVAAWVASATLGAAALVALLLLRRLGSRAVALAFGASALMAAFAWSDGPLAPRLGVACLLTELGAAIVPLGIVVRAFIKRRSAAPTAGLALAAASGALVGQAALHLTCPQRTAGLHVLVFHCGGVLLAALIAAVVGRFVARPAPELR
jgi:hypothetical protein